MLQEITRYLFSFKDDNYHLLNSFLKKNWEEDHESIRKTLANLVKGNRIEIKGQLDLNSYELPWGDIPIEGRLTGHEREKITTEMKSLPVKEYRYEILKFLFGKGHVDIRPLIEEFVSSSMQSRTYFGTLLSTMVRSQGLIRVGNIAHLSLPKYPEYSESTMMASIEPAGIYEYHKLKNMYEQPPIASAIHIETNGSNNNIVTGNGNNGDININKNDGIGKKGLTIAKQTLYWMIGIGIVTIILMILALKH